jgi:CRP/FNR family transcriptional regulator, cyclic AMP receptor protein
LIGIRAARDIAGREGWLSHTPPDFRTAILDRASLQSFSSGATIYMVGAPPGGIYGMISGGVRLQAASGNLGPFTTHYFRPGSWLGEGPIITDRPRMIGLNAARETELLHVPLPGLRELLNREPAFWRWFALLAFEHERTAVSAVADLMIRDHVKRLVAVLLRLADARTQSPKARRRSRWKPANPTLRSWPMSRAPLQTRRFASLSPPGRSHLPMAESMSSSRTRCGPCWRNKPGKP